MMTKTHYEQAQEYIRLAREEMAQHVANLLENDLPFGGLINNNGSIKGTGGFSVLMLMATGSFTDERRALLLDLAVKPRRM